MFFLSKKVSQNKTYNFKIFIGRNQIKYKCLHKGCNKYYSDRTKLYKHMRIHFGINPYKCNYCYKSFNDKGNLKVHLRTHTNERPYKCLLCAKAFKTESQLKQHTFSHFPDKPFQCPYCHQFYKRKGVLKIHMRKHLYDQDYLDKKEFFANFVEKMYMKNTSESNCQFSNSLNEESKNTNQTDTPPTPILKMIKPEKLFDFSISEDNYNYETNEPNLPNINYDYVNFLDNNEKNINNLFLMDKKINFLERVEKEDNNLFSKMEVDEISEMKFVNPLTEKKNNFNSDFFIL